jgi:hypothetical protein
MQRTDWAEQFAAKLASRPLVHECVFSNAKYLDGTEKEVCDLLLVLRESAILLQMKCQRDPLSRSGERLESWVLKNAKQAFGQLKGAIRTVTSRPFWCNHPRRGRVEFDKGQLSVVHGIVLVENLGERIQVTDLPIQFEGIPVSYFSVNDFLNIVNELRAYREILSYLNHRKALPVETLRSIGGDKVVFENYLLNGTTFPASVSYSDMEDAVANNHEALRDLVSAKKKNDVDAYLVEHVADALATRTPGYLQNLPAELAQSFDNPSKRSSYLRMQEQLCDLDLVERRALGKQFRAVINQVETNKRESDTRYGVAWLESKPDFLYVVASTKGVARQEVLRRAVLLLRGGLTFYGKADGMFIVDRDGESFEVGLVLKFVPTDDDKKAGEELFGSLRTFASAGTLTSA